MLERRSGVRKRGRETVGLRVGIVMVAVTVCALAALPAGGQVNNSKHDFSGKSAGDSETGVCTVCHTPHGGIQSQMAWNHTLSQNTHFWTEGATDDGTPLPTIDPAWGGASKLCLSCHDGSVAIGDIAWFNQQEWTGGNAVDPNDHNGDNVQIGNASGNLTGNHPFAHPYPWAGLASTYNGVTSSAGAVLSGWKTDPTLDGIRLFNQNGDTVSAGTMSGATGIECSSCHDPHEGPDVQDKFFLRGSTDADDNNYICRKCHQSMADYQRQDSLHPHGR